MSSSCGSLEIIVGPMFSGKSSALLRRLLVASELGLKILYITHTFDTRSDHVFSTHHPFLIAKNHNNIDFISLKSLKGVRKEEYDVIGIDEAQFFDEYLYEFCKIHVESYKRHVIVAGLDADSNRNKFGHILDLVPLADDIVKMKAYCLECGPKRVPAIFSYKYIDEPASHSSEHLLQRSVHIGGKERYKPLCRECYLRNI